MILSSSSSKYLINYLEPLSLYLNLSDTTILFVSTKFKSTACLEARNSFLLTTTSPNF